MRKSYQEEKKNTKLSNDKTFKYDDTRLDKYLKIGNIVYYNRNK